MNKLKTEGYQPSYIVGHEPARFGSRQEDYLARSNQIIEATAQKITHCRENKGDLKKLFFEIIADLSNKRAQIASDHQTEDAAEFGKRRDDFYPGRTSYINLDCAYKEHGDKTLSSLSKYLRQMEVNGTFKKEHKIQDTCNGRVCTLQIEVLTPKELKEKGYTEAPQSYLPDYISFDLLNNKKDEDWTSEELSDYRKRFLKFKEESAEQYRLKRISSAFLELFSRNPSPATLGLTEKQVQENYSKEEAHAILGNMKSLLVRAVLRMDIDGKMYAVTEYYTWMYENGEWMRNKTESEHPVNRMKLRSRVTLLHQDEYLIGKTLEDISKIFESAVSWNKGTQTLTELKDSMALLCHRATHNIRDVRGTAAENEWLEQAIFRSLGVKCLTNPKRMIDLEAFAHPLFSEFKKVYDEQTDLEIMKDSHE